MPERAPRPLVAIGPEHVGALRVALDSGGDDAAVRGLIAPLFDVARWAADGAHAPYSKLRVGAALACDDGRIFAGCNVENASYGLTSCAERSALAAARLEGGDSIAVAVLSSSGGAIPPCGACRQLLIELAPNAWVVAIDDTHVRRWRVRELLPDAFEGDGIP